MFGNKSETAEDRKLKQQKSSILELETQKKKIEMEKEQIQLELQNIRSREQMAIEKEKHKHELELESQKAVFEREKQIWEKEKQELIDRNIRERSEFEKNLTRDLELQHQEAVTLLKLESQQKIKQAELNADRAVNDLKTKHAEDMAEFKSQLERENFENLKEGFKDITLNGDKNSKFLQEMALKLIDKGSTINPRIGVDVNTNCGYEEEDDVYEA